MLDDRLRGDRGTRDGCGGPGTILGPGYDINRTWYNVEFMVETPGSDAVPLIFGPELMLSARQLL